jgi:hypothetical protein
MAALPLQPGGWLGALAIIACSAIAHELLHVLGWRFLGSAPWSSVSYIATRRGLGIAAVLNEPVSAAVFRAAALVPALLLGMLTLGFAFVSGSALILLWGAFFLFECITDLALLVATRALPSSARLISHPTELGCIVTAHPRNEANPTSIDQEGI